MKLTFIGVGGAFALQNWHSNMLLEINGKKLLIDAGGDVRHSLHSAGYSPKDIDAVYISHLHDDHCGGMSYLALMRYPWHIKDGNYPIPPIQLFTKGSLVNPLWDSMKATCCTVQNRITKLESFFQVNPIGHNGTFIFEGVEFRLVQTVHFMDGYDIVPSYGLIWKAPNGKQIFLTTDTQHCPNQIQDFYNSADIIFQDCETLPWEYRSGVHAHYKELSTLSDKTKSKMHLYHYSDPDKFPLPKANADGFAKFVSQGEIFDFLPTELK